MVKSDDIIFDEELEFYVSINEQSQEVCIVLSDELYETEEDLDDNGRAQIAHFINSSSLWYAKALVAIKAWVQTEYNLELISDNELELMNIYILFEPNTTEYYGLQFRGEFDVEHLYGAKITGDTFQIEETGEGDIALG